jgi:hypothetical protein
MQNLVGQAQHFPLLRIECQTVVTQVPSVQIAADRAQIGDRMQARIVQLGRVVQDQCHAGCFTHALPRSLAGRGQHLGMRHFRPVHQPVHGLIVLRLVQLRGQRASRMSMDQVGDLHQTFGSLLVT